MGPSKNLQINKERQETKSDFKEKTKAKGKQLTGTGRMGTDGEGMAYFISTVLVCLSFGPCLNIGDEHESPTRSLPLIPCCTDTRTFAVPTFFSLLKIMTLQPSLPPPVLVVSKPSSDSSRTSTFARVHPRRRSWRRQWLLLTQLTLLGLLFLSTFVLAQSGDGSLSSPPAPQPGSGSNGQGAMAPSDDSSSSKTQDSSDRHQDSITSSSTITGTAASTKPTTITTVTVINGTTTTLTLVITPTPAAVAAQQPPPPTSLPKAPQSILIIQSTSYGKVLPAAGPADDQIESHFWDQFVSREGGAKASDGSLSYLWRGSAESTTLVLTATMVIVIVALLSR